MSQFYSRLIRSVSSISKAEKAGLGIKGQGLAKPAEEGGYEGLRGIFLDHYLDYLRMKVRYFVLEVNNNDPVRLSY